MFGARAITSRLVPNQSARSAFRLQRRNFGHNFASTEERIRECTKLTQTWKNISFYFGLPLVVGYTTYVVFFAEHPHADEEPIGYDHLRTRRKPFPWGKSDETLFWGKNNH